MVGSALVPALLALPDSEVDLLIRAESDAALCERLETLLRYWGWQDDAGRRARVRAWRGDAAAPQFGLPDESYRTLAQHCTHIVHCAGTVRMNLALDDARRSAVGSATQILALARATAAAGQLSKVDVVSTVGVAGKRSGVLEETWLERLPDFHNTYEQAKAEAEQLVHAAIETEGLPITVHRPSMVIGDSSSGRVIHFQIFYFLCEFLSGRKTLGLYPDFGRVQLDIVPSDLVAKAIVAASRDPATVGRIFHLASGPAHAPRLEEVKAAIRRAFAQHGLFVPPAINLPLAWYARLAAWAARLAPPAQRRSLATLPIYLDYLADRQGFGNAGFLGWFAAQGGELPHWQAYLSRVLDYYLAARHPDAGPSNGD